MKKSLITSVMIFLLVLSFTFACFADGITVTLNGNKLDFNDQQPVIIDGRTLVPLRVIFEALGASVEWEASTSTVYSQKDNVFIKLSINSNILYRNDQPVTLDVPATIISGRTMVPARAIAEAYGVNVGWDGTTQTVILTQGEGEKADFLKTVPAYEGFAYVEINDNTPFFTNYQMSLAPFEEYAPLDELGRCGVAFVNVCKEIMPTEERGSIGNIKPSGWQTIRYEFVDGRYLYNRCHLIGYQLSGENDNIDNLITGTRYLNVEGMLPFENKIDDYVEATNNHVLYRVTPIFEHDNLVASGVLLEAYSVEDEGAGIQFCVYCYNVQPGVIINYLNGESIAEDGSAPYGSENITSAETSKDDFEVEITYVGNRNTKKFHRVSCKSVPQIKEKNVENFTCSRDEIIELGYAPCKNCNP